MRWARARIAGEHIYGVVCMARESIEQCQLKNLL